MADKSSRDIAKLPNSDTTVYRKDYHAPAFAIELVEMGFDLDRNETRVATRLHLVRKAPGALCLDGEELRLLSIAVDGVALKKQRYRLDDARLEIVGLPDVCVLDIGVALAPSKNSSLMGLYESSGNLFTQCEAQGFRRITYFMDRPDVMTRYTVMLRADRSQFPVLLCNGNQIDAGPLPMGRHFTLWHDPFPKPSYLFAVVAGRLGRRVREITLANGRRAQLEIYVEEKDLPAVEHAMSSLYYAVRWDETRFGLELDLDRFMIVAVDDFNLGAMENKGLNIFNTKYVLASPKTSTDADLIRIEALVGHEYFHNWTGNRVTCRDWFQLTLKEGLTVFRDQEFSADRAAGFLSEPMSKEEQAIARAVHRIEAVRTLRSAQFPEDAGPMAHPIRPDSYEEINNFYSTTVYEKGGEVVRMLQTLLGRETFAEGITEYFARFDGQAVTCEDFIDAMESAWQRHQPQASLTQFRRWYEQAGTPRLRVRGTFDATEKTYTLEIAQYTPWVGLERQAKKPKLPLHMPFRVGLLNGQGRDMPLRLAGEKVSDAAPTRVLSITQASQRFVFCDITEAPVPSLLREFSAPVIVDYPFSDRDLAHLAAHDSDAFNRWEALQRLAVRAMCAQVRGESSDALSRHLLASFESTLNAKGLDPMLRSLALTLPGEYVVGEELAVYDPQRVHAARVGLAHQLAVPMLQTWHTAFDANRSRTPYQFEAKAIARRALAHTALDYISYADPNLGDDLAWRQFTRADNMTDSFSALSILVQHRLAHAQAAIDQFYATHRSNAGVIDKWFRIQSTVGGNDETALTRVRHLLSHPAFSYRNPGKVQALLGGFFSSNPSAFHRALAYQFWAEQVVTVDRVNPSSAARLARAMDRWKRLPQTLQTPAQEALQGLAATPKLSRDVSEIIHKALNA